MSRLRTFFLYAIPVTAFLATFAMVFHALPYTRQVDVQHIEYAFKLLKSLHDGVPGEYLMHPQKYPLLSVLPLSLLYGAVLVALRFTGKLPSFGQTDIETYLFTAPVEVHLVTRLVVYASAVLLCVLVYKSCRRIAPKANPWYAIALLLSSMLLLTFASSMRQHVPEVMLIMSSFYFSLKYSEDRTWKNEALAFGSALVSFCVLQNGIFTFFFPVFAVLFEKGTLQFSRLTSPRLWMWLLGSGILAVLLGYPFLLKEVIFDHRLGIGLGNEDIGETPWNPQGFIVLARTLLGSETFVLLFGLLGLLRFTQGKNPLHPFFLSALIYCIAYSIFFGFVGWATPRYFFPIVPFLAILGAEALQSSRLFVPYAALLTLVHVKLLSFAILPDTYDVAKQYLLTTTGSIATDQPFYFLGIPPSKTTALNPKMARESFIKSLPQDLPNARQFLPLSDAANADIIVMNPWSQVTLPSTYGLCKSAASAPRRDRMYLWSEVEWSYLWIFQTERAGPSIEIACKK